MNFVDSVFPAPLSPLRGGGGKKNAKNRTTKKHDTHITHIQCTCTCHKKIWTRVKVDLSPDYWVLFLSGPHFFLIYQPDQHTLVLPHSPEGDVDLIGDGVDVRRFLTQLCVLIFLHQVQAVYTLNLLVGVDRTQDGANVGLREGRGGREGGGREEGEGRGGEGRRERGRKDESINSVSKQQTPDGTWPGGQTPHHNSKHAGSLLPNHTHTHTHRAV